MPAPALFLSNRPDELASRKNQGGFRDDPDSIGVTPKCPSKISSTGNEKISRSSRITAELKLLEAATVFLKVSPAERAAKPSGDRFQNTLVSCMVAVCVCCRGSGYHAIVGNSLMTVETNREKPLRLALIGMSGAGKTFWTRN